MPLYDVVSQLIYSTQASQVSHVWSSGEALLYDSKLQTIDEQQLKQTTQEWQLRVNQIAHNA
jgi:5-methylthioadenosine/S-adenosylhomocysteine deaminase